MKSGKATAETNTTKQQWLISLLLALITIAAFLPTLNNTFVNYDDPLYVYDARTATAQLVQQPLSSENLKTIFTKPFHGNYHPLTVLSLKLDYTLFGLKETNEFIVPALNATGYHAINLLLHITSVLLLFFFVLQLVKTLPPFAAHALFIATTVALLFAVHPTRVGSVAWISERKDMLYVLFYFAGLLTYLKYSATKQTKYYVFTMLFFILSLLSKGMAVVFPVTLVLIDYLQGTINRKSIAQKIPFFLLSLGAGLLAIQGQSDVDAIADTPNRTWADVIFYASYAVADYLKHFIFPFGLSPMYPYPVKTTTLSTLIYLFFAGMLVCAFLLWKYRQHKWLVFGTVFFMAHIIPVLQWVPIGDSLVTERFTYLSYVGLFFVVAIGISKINALKTQVRWASVAVIAIVLLVQTHIDCKIWHDSITFRRHAVQMFPYEEEYRKHLCITYMDRAGQYAMKGFLAEAMQDCDSSIATHPMFYDGFVNRGVLTAMRGRLDFALVDFRHAAAIRDEFPNAWVMLAKATRLQGHTDSAILYYTKAIERDSFNNQNYYQRYLLSKVRNDDTAALSDSLALLQRGFDFMGAKDEKEIGLY